jgi:hypothetical protein
LYWLLNYHEGSHGKCFSKSILDTDFKPEIEEKNFIDEAIIGALEE